MINPRTNEGILTAAAHSMNNTPRPVNVVRCQRCGLDHTHLVFWPLANPADDYTHFASCPTIGEPVLLKVTENKSMNYETRNDQRISYADSQKDGWFARVVRSVTRWAWRSQVRAPINRAHERGQISSQVFHDMHDYANRVVDATPPLPVEPNW